jgi:hypothetical protein
MALDATDVGVRGTYPEQPRLITSGERALRRLWHAEAVEVMISSVWRGLEKG